MYFMRFYMLHQYNYRLYKKDIAIQARCIVFESGKEGTDLPKHLEHSKEKKNPPIFKILIL